MLAISLIFACFFVALLVVLVRRHKKDVRERQSTALMRTGGFHLPAGQNKQASAMRIYLLLSAWLLKKNSIYSIEKENFIINHLNELFNENTAEIRFQLTQLKAESIHMRSVAHWVVELFKSSDERAALMTFLVEINFQSGTDIIDREFTSLIRFGELIGIRAEFIDRKVVAQRKALLGEGDFSERFSRFGDSNVRRKLALAVLDLLGDATEKQIKMRYRELAKIHHPDVFVGKSPEEEQVNYNRFLEIQDAYEELMEG